MAIRQQTKIQKRLGNACATAHAGRTKWTLGTKALQLEFTLRDGHFCLAGLCNTLPAQAKEYGLGQAAWDMLPLGVGGWSFVSDEISPAMDGGWSVLQVAITLENAGLQMTIRARVYQSDLGRAPYTNYYFSNFEPPDKVGDLLHQDPL